MEVDLIFKIAAIGILVAVFNQLLVRSGREEQAMMVTLAGLIDSSRCMWVLTQILRAWSATSSNRMNSDIFLKFIITWYSAPYGSFMPPP